MCGSPAKDCTSLLLLFLDICPRASIEVAMNLCVFEKPSPFDALLKGTPIKEVIIHTVLLSLSG